MADAIPEALLARIKAVTNKRARLVLDKIVENGRISTEELMTLGYNHPPRAARDVRELGILLKTIKVRHSDGRSIGAYVLDLEGPATGKSGRLALPKKERDVLLQAAGSKCQICAAEINLQVDHRIPYEVAGESQSGETDPYQILDGACNRKKSWACEHCKNWLEDKVLDVCRTCYWANPVSYTHVAMQPERRADLVWIGAEVADFDRLRQQAEQSQKSVAEQIKLVIKKNPK
jgi:hypothetical protein